MSKQLQLDVAQLTDVGRKRPHNEDNMAYVIPKDPAVMAKKGALFIVADGMGGHAAGEVASEIAVDTISNVYYQDSSDDITVSLVRAIKRANVLIHMRAAENMLRNGMGTTCVAAVLRGNVGHIANVGDSRAYMVRKGQVKQVSQDHSWVEEQVRAGLLTRDQARSHAQRNVITRCLGTQADVEVDIFSEQLEAQDTFVLCTDGLSGLIGEEELGSIVERFAPQESVYHLVERANENGGTDNITAIVTRVIEVGDPEPPSALHPVHAGGRDVSNETTKMIGSVPGTLSAMSTANLGEGLAASATPTFASSGPLLSNEAGQPASSPPTKATRKRSRLFYISIALLVVVLLLLVGLTAYYFLGTSLGITVDVDSSLTHASTLIEHANNEVARDPTAALKDLAGAQKDLRSAQASPLPLNSEQQKTFGDLQNKFTPAVKSAITAYNQQSSIVTLPCTNTVSSVINNGGTNTQAISITIVHDGKGNALKYVLGGDHALYQVDDHSSLVNKTTAPGAALMIGGTNQDVLAVSSQADKGYALNLWQPTNNGALGNMVSTPIDPTLLKNGQVPKLMTAWDHDVYVILTSTSAQNMATLLDYTITNDNKFDPNPRVASIAISANIVSVAAWPNHQMFLLYSDGNIQSLQFNNSTQAASIRVQRPIPTTLPVSAKTFTPAENVPLPGPTPSSFLTVPAPSTTHTTFLATGMTDTMPHLYIVDGISHRILDLKAGQNAAVSPQATANGTGGGISVASAPITMELAQQYAAAGFIDVIRGASADMQNPALYLLTSDSKDAAQMSLLSVKMGQKSACTP